MSPMIPMDYVLRSFYEQIQTRVRPLLYEFNIAYGALTMSENKDKDSEAKVTTDATRGNQQDFLNTDLPYLFWIDGNIVANKGIQRDSFETQIMEKFLENDMKIRLSETGTLHLQPMVVLEDMDLIKHCTFAMTNVFNVHCYTDTQEQWGSDKKHTLMYATIAFLRMSSILICPYVSFEPREYTVKQEFVDIMPRTTVILQLDGTKVYINEPKDLLMVDVDSNGDLNVCQDLLDTKLPPKSGLKKKTLDEVTFAEYVLTLIFVGVSMVCLLLTLITYSRFEALRTLAGINNMCLCASLLLAQASMIASSLVQGPQALCTALGITTHYLWLCMFMCSFNCCFHMFRVFTAKTRSSHTTARLQNVRLAKNIMASVTLPGVVVGCVMVASYVSSKGKEIGYGADACYLNSEILVGASMIGPLLLTIVCNLIFFLVVVYKIQQVRKLQNDSFNKDDRQNLYVYIKLSTMTGAFWIIQVLAEVADLHVFRFIAIVLNGLQGVFIFVSYTCNKRVAQLYHCSCPRREGVRSEGTRESRIELTSPKAEGNTEDTTDGEK